MAAAERRLRVLVVEDNRDAATVLVRLLQHSGFDAEAVYNGLDAIGAAERFQPDCVLSDIGLPGLDGYDVARQFRSHNSLNRVALIALSAYDESAKMRAAGFDHHMLKPVSAAALFRALFDVRKKQSL
jgi:two-component system CheB/CheR fusion protein